MVTSRHDAPSASHGDDRHGQGMPGPGHPVEVGGRTGTTVTVGAQRQRESTASEATMAPKPTARFQ